MRRGCISSGNIQCHGCQSIIPHSQRYLAIEEENGVEAVEGGETVFYCTECALKKGYATYKEEKDGRILTFFP